MSMQSLSHTEPSVAADDLEDLYRRYGDDCLQLARQIVRDVHKAEDVVQEAFLDMWRQADRHDDQRSSARSWLLMLTHRRAVDRVRHEQSRRALSLDDSFPKPDDRPGPEQTAIEKVLSGTVLEALALLPFVQREAIVLAYWGGRSQSEIALLTGAPLGTVKTRMLHGLRRLRRALHTDGDYADPRGPPVWA